MKTARIKLTQHKINHIKSIKTKAYFSYKDLTFFFTLFYDHINELPCSDPYLAVNLTFLTGVILVVLGLFNLGFLVNFISHAIIVGFCSAASIVIAGTWVHDQVTAKSAVWIMIDRIWLKWIRIF